MSGGKNKQKQSSQQSSQQSSFGQSFVAPFQQQFLERLFGQANTVASQQLASPVPQKLGGQLLGQGQDFQNILGGISRSFAPGVGGEGGAIQGLLGFARGGGEFDQLLGESPGLQGSLGSLQDAIQQNLAATAGTIGGQATLQGQTGGSRQALATGLAGQEAQRQFAGGASQLIGQDFAARQALAPQILAAQSGAFQAAGQLGLQQRASQVGAAQSGLGSLGSLFNLGLAPGQAAFGPLEQLAQILGPAIQLSFQQSQGSGTGTGSGSGSGFQFGF